MASNKNLKDLQWVLQALESGNCINLQKVSIFLSQQTSGCYQETESSININLSKENNALFDYLITELSTMTKNSVTSALRNLEFHRVIWEVEYLKSLKSLLENNAEVKQIVFRRNDFSLDCLQELSEILKRDEHVKEIIFCESCIGARGAGIIADALKVNDSLEELQIWEDSVGLRGAEELSKMIEVNTSLKLLIVFDASLLIATPIISAVLARNRDMEVHIWSAEKGEKCSKVVEFVPENNTLRIYRLDISGTCRVACSLGMNTIVKVLDMTGVRLKSKWAREFRWVLEQNRTLKEVKLSRCWLKDKGVVYVSAGLFKNRSMEILHLDGNCFTGVGVEHLVCPLSRFTALQCQANTTLKTLTFGGERMRVGRAGLEAILQMITSNQSLSRLGIFDDQGLRPDDIVRIFQSLEKNASLKYLSLKGCKGVKGESVLQAIVETLQVNPWIEEIDLEDTPLHKAGMAEGIYQKLGQNARSDEPDTDFFKDMPMITPTSCRVFICGQEYAGKSTLCNAISYNFSSTKLPYVDQVRTLVNPVEQAIKSEGMKVRNFKDEGTKISIWNLADQQVLCSLHDLMFPGHGSASCFLVLISLFRKPSNKEMKNTAEIEEDLQYWLRFIVSNSRRAVQQCMLPNVTIVLTHFDKIPQHSQNFQAIVNTIQGLRDKFNGFLEFYPTVFTVDARSSTSVSKLTQHIRNTSKMILQRVPRVYELCNDLAEILVDWRKENDNKPTMSWKEFGELCQVKVPPLRVQSRFENKEKTEVRRRAVANCLHQIGEIIYFDDPGLFILDTEWFCQEVLGQLVCLKAARKQGSIRNGFITRKDLEKILKGTFQSQLLGMNSKVFGNLEASDIVKMMLKLELCYEQDPNDPNSAIFVPSFLEEGRQKPQKWQFSSADCVYAGRHLECDDSSRTFLTAGFFPHLQVYLHNKFMALKDQHGATYSMENSLILININGIDVRVELGGQLSHYIDILACSTKNLTETLRLIHQLIIPAIHDICQGVVLIENIIRPECVKSLTPPRYRKTQFLALHKLKAALLTVPADGMYDYQHTWSAVSDAGKPIIRAGFDFARDLLSDDDFREVLHRRYHDLYNLANELNVPPENDPDSISVVTSETDPSIDPSFSGIAKGVEQVLQRLKIIEQEIRDLKQEIQGLRYYEHRLLLELHRKVDHLVNYNVQIEERKVPNMFFFVRTENYSRRLVTTIISGMTAMRLHMLCEFRREMHVVEDQMGCEVMQVDNLAVKCLAPYMTKFMTLLTFALKIGTHLVTGMGSMIPDLGKEAAHLLDSSLMTGAAGAAGAAALGAMAVGSSRTRDRSRNIQQDQKAAQQWVLDFLRDRGCSTGRDIAEKFGLWRVKYRDTGQVAWICKRHMSLRANEIVEVPL